MAVKIEHVFLRSSESSKVSHCHKICAQVSAAMLALPQQSTDKNLAQVMSRHLGEMKDGDRGGLFGCLFVCLSVCSVGRSVDRSLFSFSLLKTAATIATTIPHHNHRHCRWLYPPPATGPNHLPGSTLLAFLDSSARPAFAKKKSTRTVSRNQPVGRPSVEKPRRTNTA